MSEDIVNQVKMASGIHLQREYGYVVLTVISSLILLMYLSIKVSMARKKYDVRYPDMYTTDDKKKIFNCIQRAHQNTLEYYPQIMVMLLLSGLQHPLIASTAGFVWVISRFVYAIGYSTGDPSKRNLGAFGVPAMFTLLGCTISCALHLLQVV